MCWSYQLKIGVNPLETESANMKTKTALTVLLVLLTILNAHAYRIEEITTDPAAAVSGDDVTIVISGMFPDTGSDITSVQIDIVGDTLNADLIGFYQGGGGQMETPFTETIHWGELETGQYYIHVRLYMDWNDEIRLMDDTTAVISIEESIDRYPNLVISNGNVDPEIQYFPVRELNFNYEISNISDYNTAGQSRSYFYFSDVDVLEEDNRFYRTTRNQLDSIPANESLVINGENLPLRRINLPGEYFVIVDADGDEDVVESDENDNRMAISFTIVDTIDHHTTPIDSFETPGPAKYLKIVDNVAYIICRDTTGLALFDVTDIENPVELSFTGFGQYPLGVVIIDEMAYIQDSRYGIFLLQVTNPRRPEILSYIDIGGIGSFAVEGSYLYVVGNDLGLVVFDISNRESPELVGSSNDEISYYCINIRNDLAITWGRRNRSMYNIQQPENPEIVSSTRIEYDVKFANFQDDIAFLAVGESIRTLNFADPFQPVELSRYIADAGIGSISIDGNFAYIANHDEGLMILNVDNPWEITRIGEYYSKSPVLCADFRDEYVFIANSFDRVTIVSNNLHGLHVPKESSESETTEFELQTCYPNPFNSSINIAFSIPLSSEVSIQIYNTNGQLVETVLEKPMPAGKQSVVWNAGGAPAGIYFLKMIADDNQFSDKVRKVVLIR
jgi:hypothetical protein